MRVGTPITIFLIILVLFGFVLSEYFQVSEDYANVVNDLTSQSEILEETSTSLNTCEANLNQALQTIAELETTIAGLNEQIKENESTITSLNTTNVELESKLSEIEGLNNFQQAVITELNNKIQEQQNEINFKNGLIAQLNNQRSEAQSAEAKMTLSSTLPEGSLAEIILVAIIIAQLILTLTWNSRIRLQPKARQIENEYVRLTPEERSMIARHRRNHTK